MEEVDLSFIAHAHMQMQAPLTPLHTVTWVPRHTQGQGRYTSLLPFLGEANHDEAEVVGQVIYRQVRGPLLSVPVCRHPSQSPIVCSISTPNYRGESSVFVTSVLQLQWNAALN